MLFVAGARRVRGSLGFTFENVRVLVRILVLDLSVVMRFLRPVKPPPNGRDTPAVSDTRSPV